MDGHRFDHIARLVTSGGNRRQILRALGIGAAGVVGLGRSNRAASHEAPMAACGQASDCAMPDADPCTGVQCLDGTCSVSSVLCAAGYTCCGNGECCPAPAACRADTDCAVADGDPCTGARCEGGICVYAIVSCAPGYACCGNGTCCPAWWPVEWTMPALPPR